MLFNRLEILQFHEALAQVIIKHPCYYREG